MELRRQPFTVSCFFGQGPRIKSRMRQKTNTGSVLKTEAGYIQVAASRKMLPEDCNLNPPLLEMGIGSAPACHALYNPVRQHGLGHLGESGDIRAHDVITFFTVSFRRVHTGFMNVFHNNQEPVVHLFPGP